MSEIKKITNRMMFANIIAISIIMCVVVLPASQSIETQLMQNENGLDCSNTAARDFLVRSYLGEEVKICIGYNSTTMDCHGWTIDDAGNVMSNGWNEWIYSTFDKQWCFNSIEELEEQFPEIIGEFDPKW